MTDITTVASPATAQPAVPPILFTKDLPGPLSLNRLAAFGTLHKLDDSAGYWIEHSGTLYGRAKIVAEVAPFGTVVCSMTAAWVWLGGPDFPSTIDVISTSHFRCPRTSFGQTTVCKSSRSIGITSTPDAHACFLNRCSRRWTNRLWSNAHDEGVHCQRPSQRPPCRSPFTAFAAGATVASPRGGGTLIRIRIARNLGYDRAA